MQYFYFSIVESIIKEQVYDMIFFLIEDENLQCQYYTAQIYESFNPKY